MKTLNLIKFINENSNWKILLSKEPYYIKIKEDDNYYHFHYNLFLSDLKNPIVKECRGMVIRKSDFTPVCVPFFAFRNYNEPNSDKDLIDWNSAVALEKIDGSMICYWYDDNDDMWHLSTSGTTNAYNAPLNNFNNISNQFDSYGQLFDFAYKNANQMFDLPKGYTYIFELVSPYNRIVVPYEETKIYLLAVRNNKTLEEENVRQFCRNNNYLPKQYKFNDLESCVDKVKTFTFENEGFVVVDKFYNRIKIKSPEYLIYHKTISNNHVISKEIIINMIFSGDDIEFTSYFPEYNEDFKRIKLKIFDKIEEIKDKFNKFKQSISFIVNDSDDSKLIWSLLRTIDVESYIRNQNPKSILKMINEI